MVNASFPNFFSDDVINTEQVDHTLLENSKNIEK